MVWLWSGQRAETGGLTVCTRRNAVLYKGAESVSSEEYLDSVTRRIFHIGFSLLAGLSPIEDSTSETTLFRLLANMMRYVDRKVSICHVQQQNH